jgi:CRP/FNR family transcriptional regulator, cyclic AMP receptor protein
VFGRRGWLAQQDEVFRHAVLSRGHRLEVRKGQPLFFAGDAAGGVYGLVSGSLGVYTGMPHQDPLLGHIHRPGAWLGEGPATTGEPRFLTVAALEPSTLLQIPRVLITQMEAEGFGIRARLAQQLWSGQMQAIRVISDLLIPRAPRRVAAVLLRVTGDGEAEAGHADGFVLTQSQLAQMANCSRHMVNRTFRELEHKGWITTRYNRVRILDEKALTDFAYAEGESAR